MRFRRALMLAAISLSFVASGCTARVNKVMESWMGHNVSADRELGTAAADNRPRRPREGIRVVSRPVVHHSRNSNDNDDWIGNGVRQHGEWFRLQHDDLHTTADDVLRCDTRVLGRQQWDDIPLGLAWAIGL